MKWYENAVFYHMYPLGLCGAPKLNTEEGVVNRFSELENWIPHMRDLGCTAIYIGPLFESVGHGYETTDYKLVDRRLGTNESFIQFVDLCHKEGIKVVVDGVFNHTGREFFAFKDVQQNREHSRYKDWYCKLNFSGNNEYNDGFSYEAWRGHNVLVKLNQRNPEVKNYIFDVIRYWVNEFNIDGIRLDCADVLDFDLMKDMRSVCNTVKDDFWLMGEVIHGDYSRWSNSDMLHSVTNYEMHKGLYSGHNDHNYFEIAHTVKRLFGEHSPVCKNEKLYSFVDNHDVDRIYSKLTNKKHMIPVHILLYTLPGIPSIYYGSEFAIEGQKKNGNDDYVRPEIKLQDYRALTKLDETAGVEEILGLYKSEYRDLLEILICLAAAKKEYVELTEGYYKELMLTNRQYSFARVFENKATVIMVNNDDSGTEISVNLPIQSTEGLDLINGEKLMINNGRLSLQVPANSGRVIKLI